MRGCFGPSGQHKDCWVYAVSFIVMVQVVKIFLTVLRTETVISVFAPNLVRCPDHKGIWQLGAHFHSCEILTSA